MRFRPLLSSKLAIAFLSRFEGGLFRKYPMQDAHYEIAKRCLETGEEFLTTAQKDFLRNVPNWKRLTDHQLKYLSSCLFVMPTQISGCLNRGPVAAFDDKRH